MGSPSGFRLSVVEFVALVGESACLRMSPETLVRALGLMGRFSVAFIVV